MTTPARQHADRLAELLRIEHHAMADFLVALAAFDEGRRWAELGHANLWAFLHRDLGLSAGAAHCRKVAARLVRGFPAVEAALRAGRLCLSSVVELAKVLTPANETSVLPRYFRLSAREARELTAELAPRPIIPVREVTTAVVGFGPAESIFQTSEAVVNPPEEGARAAPPGGAAPMGRPVAPVHGESAEVTPSHAAPSAVEVAPPVPDGRRRAQDSTTAGLVLGQTGAGYPAESVPGGLLRSARGDGREAESEQVVPVSADLRRLHLTVSRRFLEKLEAAKSLRSHAQPGASAAAILETALDHLLAREAKRKKAAESRPALHQRPCAPGRVPAAVRREVWARDEGRCQWPLAAGGVCGSIFRLEIDHVLPRARGGPPTVANLRVLCGPHNAEAARRAYGAVFMERVVADAKEARSGKDDGPSALAKGPSGVAPQA